MRRIGIGRVLALAGCVALGAGGFALASGGDDGDSGVAQAREGGERAFGPPGLGPPPEFGLRRDGRPHRGFAPRFRRPSEKELREWRADFAKRIRERRQELAKQLADELDKSTDEVLDAFRAVFKRKLDEAVKDKDLTQKQADRILECYDSAECGPLGFGGGFGFGHRFGFGGPPHPPPPLP
jgi:hypothetical protein